MQEHRHVKTIPVAVGLILLCASTTVADEAPELESGAQIRVEVASGPDSSKTKRFTGTVLALDDELITLRTARKRPPVELARCDLRSLELKKGGYGALDGAGRGILVGIGVAVVIGMASGSDDPNHMFSFSATDKAIILSIVFMPVGATIGAIAAPGEEWETVPVDSPQLGLGYGPEDGYGACVSFRF